MITIKSPSDAFSISGNIISASYSYDTPSIISATVNEARVEITKRAKPLFNYTSLGSAQPSDKVWKEIWELREGRLVRLPDIEGRHTPPYTIPEAIAFP